MTTAISAITSHSFAETESKGAIPVLENGEATLTKEFSKTLVETIPLYTEETHEDV